jgi:glycine/D-amino acid oxidase-like deaminating enzyme
MATQQAVDVVIVGGGIAGSALAAVLARHGLAVTVLEQQRAYADLHAALFCSFGPAGVQRRGQFLGRLASGADPRLQWVVAAPLLGPYNLPQQAFEDSFRAEVLGAASA